MGPHTYPAGTALDAGHLVWPLGLPPLQDGDVLDRKMFLVKERVGFLKLVDTFDIHDPATGAKIGIAQEKIGTLAKLLRLIVSKRMLPTNVEIREHEDGPALLSIKRGFTLLRSKVRVLNKAGQEIGRFKSKL